MSFRGHPFGTSANRGEGGSAEIGLRWTLLGGAGGGNLNPDVHIFSKFLYKYFSLEEEISVQ